jgi:hypothetical protein
VRRAGRRLTEGDGRGGRGGHNGFLQTREATEARGANTRPLCTCTHAHEGTQEKKAGGREPIPIG